MWVNMFLKDKKSILRNIVKEWSKIKKIDLKEQVKKSNLYIDKAKNTDLYELVLKDQINIIGIMSMIKYGALGNAAEMFILLDTNVRGEFIERF